MKRYLETEKSKLTISPHYISEESEERRVSHSLAMLSKENLEAHLLAVSLIFDQSLLSLSNIIK